MKQPKLVHIFQAAQRMPRSRAVEQCIISLPEIRKNYSLLPLLKLQMLSLPGSVYGLALAAVLVQQIFSFTDLPLLEVLPVRNAPCGDSAAFFPASDAARHRQYERNRKMLPLQLWSNPDGETAMSMRSDTDDLSHRNAARRCQQAGTRLSVAARAACGLRRFARLDLGELCQPFGHCADDGLSGGRIGRQYDAGNDTGDGNADCLCGSAADRGGSRMARKDSDEQEELR